MPRPPELDYEAITGSTEAQADLRTERIERENVELSVRFAELEADVQILKRQVNDLLFHQA